MFHILFLLLSVCFISAIHLPQFIPRCYRNDPKISNCILNASNDLKCYLKNGIEKMELPSFGHVQLPNLIVNHSTYSSDIFILFRNLTFEDLDKFALTHVEFHSEDVSLKGEINYSQLPFSTYCSIMGKFANKTANGDAYFKGVMVGVRGFFLIKADLFRNGLNEYCNVRDVQFRLSINEIGGDLNQSKNSHIDVTTEFINRYSALVAKEVEPIYGTIFKQYLQKYLIRLCKDVPYNDLFPYSINNIE